jgi:hypothetical protein
VVKGTGTVTTTAVATAMATATATTATAIAAVAAMTAMTKTVVAATGKVMGTHNNQKVTGTYNNQIIEAAEETAAAATAMAAAAATTSAKSWNSGGGDNAAMVLRYFTMFSSTSPFSSLTCRGIHTEKKKRQKKSIFIYGTTFRKNESAQDFQRVQIWRVWVTAVILFLFLWAIE